MTYLAYFRVRRAKTFGAPLRRLVAALTLAFGASILAPAATAQESAAPYQLGSGDQIALRVVVWVEQTRNYDVWQAVSGAYTVRPDGRLRLPIGSTFEAAGQTADALSDQIAATLQTSLGSVEPPGVSIEVTQYRPFYVLGHVNAPGAFPARPGLTVLQAFALAGGARRTSAEYTNPLSGMRDSGQLRQTMIDIARAQVRLARLEAQINDDEAITVPEDISHPEGSAALAQVVSDETAVFASHATAYALEVANLNELKVLLATEIASLEEKFLRLGKQVELARDSMARIDQLSDAGLVRSNRTTDAQRQLFEVESQELDLQTAIFRSQQRMKEADRDLVALRTRRVTDATTERLRVASELEQLQARRQTLRALITEAGVAAPDTTEQTTQTQFFLTAEGGTAEAEVQVGPEQRIAPGDTLRIALHLSEE